MNSSITRTTETQEFLHPPAAASTADAASASSSPALSSPPLLFLFFFFFVFSLLSSSSRFLLILFRDEEKKKTFAPLVFLLISPFPLSLILPRMMMMFYILSFSDSHVEETGSLFSKKIPSLKIPLLIFVVLILSFFLK